MLSFNEIEVDFDLSESDFNELDKFSEYGTFLHYGDGVAWINGLKWASMGELVVFEKSILSIAFALDSNLTRDAMYVFYFCIEI